MEWIIFLWVLALIWLTNMAHQTDSEMNQKEIEDKQRANIEWKKLCDQAFDYDLSLSQRIQKLKEKKWIK